MPPDSRVIAIGATFTAEAIQPAMAFWASELALGCEIRFAAYNQLFQELLDPNSLFGRNQGFNVALVRLEDWAAAGIEASAQLLARAIQEASARLRAPLIVAICPARRPSEENDRAIGLLRAATAELGSVYWLLPEEMAELYPVAEVHDPDGDELGRVPYTPIFFAALATAIARRIHALATPPFKAIALDCDDTLWAGICGEDGPQGVTIDAPRLALQRFMLERRHSGMLLTLCSKNNEADVVETFRAHPEMPLRLDYFTGWRINWDAKGANLVSLADELGLGLDSFILVDDNPKECREAQAGAPAVLALPLPARAAEIPDFLRHVWAFDRARVTNEDLRRAGMYTERAERARAERSAGSLQEFLDSLELEITLAPLAPADAARVAQLTQRTNQMNATLARSTEAEMRALDAECWTVRVRDRFGDYGLTGAVIFHSAADALVVDTFLLSCRALGRGVEHRMVAKLGEIARARGLARVEIPFVAGQRNRPAKLFLETIGGGRLTAEQAAAVWYEPASLPDGRSPVEASRSPRNGDGAPSRTAARLAARIDYLRIATELRDPEAVLRATRMAAAGAPSVPRAVSAPPRTPLELQLAGLWADLLNLPAVGIHDNFFELGGHSLLAVQLLSRVRQTLGVDVSLEVVYSGDFTVAELAKAIELKEIEQSSGDYQDLLRELEDLSDDQVRAMLAEEQDAS
jgi:FkbH-like protein